MKRVVFDDSDEKINLAAIHELIPIFAKQGGRICGMVVEAEKGWILFLGGSRASDGYHETRELCIKSGHKYGYEFFIDD